ncbi:diacylglycerol acyltransferase-domain-containing protein [Xylariaceae sp. FL0662B]|nr:diacylglycerol acyltransferase-domain-containing protein [Xylariaceae sp. FL0662B]
MADDESPTSRRRGLSINSRGSRLPRFGQRRSSDNMRRTDPGPSSRLSNQPNSIAPDVNSLLDQRRQRDSRSPSLASRGSNELPSPITPPGVKVSVTKTSTPRIVRGDHICTPKPAIPPPLPKPSPSTAPTTSPSPELPSLIPRGLGYKSSPPRHIVKRKASKVKETSNMSNEAEGKSRNLNPESKEASESRTNEPGPQGSRDAPKEEPEVHVDERKIKPRNGDESIEEKEEHGAYDEDSVRTAVEGASEERPEEQQIDDDRSTADDSVSYASALKSDLNGLNGNLSTLRSPLRSLPNGHDDDDSYPELDEMSLEEAHPPPKPNVYGGIRWAPWDVPPKRRLQTLVLLMHCICMGTLVSVFFAFCANPFTWPLLLIYLLFVLSSKAATDGSLKYRSDWFRRSYIWRLFADYFPARLHKTHDLPRTRKYIFGYHPHGIISHGAWAAFATEALGFSEKFPGITNSLLTLDSNFRIPFYREYILGMGMRSVSKESIVNILTKGGSNGEGMGRAVTIVVGGARESLEAQPGLMRLILKERKGFVKIAVRTGADLVPVLAFGENNLYDQLQPAEHPLVHKIQIFVLKVWKFTVPFLHGRGIFNYDVGLMPYRRPLNVVVGAPIKVTQSAVVDQAEINRLHRLYVAELQKLWDLYKDEFAPERKEEMQILS